MDVNRNPSKDAQPGGLVEKSRVSEHRSELRSGRLAKERGEAAPRPSPPQSSQLQAINKHVAEE